MTIRAWLQRHGPVWPVVWGTIAIAISLVTLVALGWGICSGRPTTPTPLAIWLAASTLALVLTAFEWSRWPFLLFGLLLLVANLILLNEFGEVMTRQDVLLNAQSTEQVLVLQLSRAEHVAAANQIKSLAASSTGPASATSTGLGTAADLRPSIDTLRWDLQRVLDQTLAPQTLITRINFDQIRVSSSLLAARSTQPSASVSIVGPALSLRWSSYVSDGTDSLEQLCRQVGPPPSGDPSWLCSKRSKRQSLNLSPAQLAQAVSSAASAVSTTVGEVLPTPANAQVVSADDKALVGGFSAPPHSPATAAADLSVGAGAMLAFFEGASLGGSWWYSPLGLGGWVVAALVLLLLLRGLLLVNNQNGWGPIEVVIDSVDDKQTTSPEDAQRLAKIRSYVIENVPEPAAALGSNAITQITTMVTSANLGAPTWLRAIANFAEWALLPPSGYRVLVDFRTPAASSNEMVAPHRGEREEPPDTRVVPRTPTGEHHLQANAAPPGDHQGRQAAPQADPAAPTFSVVVRIATRGRSRTLSVTTINSVAVEAPGTLTASQQEDIVLRSAGYWAAGWILSHCQLVPIWSVWPAQAGPYLGRFRTVVEANKDTLADPEHQDRQRVIDLCIEHLEDARAAGPTSGAVLTLLAEQYEFKNDFRNALELHLELVHLYPRYYVARYRAAVGLSLLVSPNERRWTDATRTPDQQHLRILGLVQEIAAGGSSTASIVERLKNDRTSPEEVRAEISVLSAAQLQAGRRLAHGLAMVAMSLRKDERRFWWSRLRHPFLIRHNLGSAMPSIAKAAGYEEGAGPNAGLPPTCPRRFFDRPTLSQVSAWSRSRKESAQVLYNLACFYAPEPSDRESQERAVELLEQTQLQPYANQIRGSWMARDPDLDPLKHAPSPIPQRFDRLLQLLRGGELARSSREIEG